MFGDTVMEGQTAVPTTQTAWQKFLTGVTTAVKTTVGTITPAVTAMIQQKTMDKLGQAQAYQMQLTPAAPDAGGAGSTAKKAATWVVPALVGGGLLLGGILLMRKRK